MVGHCHPQRMTSCEWLSKPYSEAGLIINGRRLYTGSHYYRKTDFCCMNARPNLSLSLNDSENKERYAHYFLMEQHDNNIILQVLNYS